MKKKISNTYQLIYYKDYIAYIMVDKELCTLTFDGGFVVPFRYNGTYTTDDPALIKAIESSPQYESIFKKISTTDTLDNDDEGATDGENEKTVKTTSPETEQVPNITSGQKARAYLLSRFEELKSSDLKTNDIIIEVALTKGITFPDWELN